MGEELKPVRCGCGGKVAVYVTHYWGKCYVCQCDDCGMSTKPCDTEAEAIHAWNRAMLGGYKLKPTEQKKGEWIAHEGYVECNLCHIYLTSEWHFCPNCGAEMTWR